ncbi:MAG: hypothetical protein KKC46_22870 [Proteobacteria bacterium]|nr:hypothetical protein [Pseudomonadota bacterium]
MLERKLNVSSAELANFMKNNTIHQRAVLYKRHKNKNIAAALSKGL